MCEKELILETNYSEIFKTDQRQLVCKNCGYYRDNKCIV